MSKAFEIISLIINAALLYDYFKNKGIMRHKDAQIRELTSFLADAYKEIARRDRIRVEYKARVMDNSTLETWMNQARSHPVGLEYAARIIELITAYRELEKKCEMLAKELKSARARYHLFKEGVDYAYGWSLSHTPELRPYDLTDKMSEILKEAEKVK